MSFTLTPKRRKTLYILLAVVIGIGSAVGLALYALSQNIDLFFTPSQLAEEHVPEGQRIQVGGLVMQGTVHRDPQSLAIRFSITDLKKQVDVVYTGILPDLFREGQGIIANGRLKDGVVQADEILAKHDETYMPPKVKHAIEAAGHPAGK